MAGIETEIARDKGATDNVAIWLLQWLVIAWIQQRRVSYGNEEEIMGDDDEETAVEAFERRKKVLRRQAWLMLLDFMAQ